MFVIEDPFLQWDIENMPVGSRQDKRTVCVRYFHAALCCLSSAGVALSEL
jgi:hypothetical protein